MAGPTPFLAGGTKTRVVTRMRSAFRHGGVRAATIGLACVGAAGCGLDLQGALVLYDGGTGGQSLTNGDDGSTAFGSGSSSGGSGSGGGSGSTIGDTGDAGSDAGAFELPDGSCDFNGTWATKVVIAVAWVPQSLAQAIIAPGTGQVEQWVKSQRVQHGTSTVDTAVVCGIALPDFSSEGFVGGETYGVRFPDSLFDNDYLPTFTIAGTLSDTSPTAKYNSQPGAALLGVSLNNATTAAWPATVTTTNPENDNNPGVTADMASGPLPNGGGSYSPLAVDLNKTRADQVYLAIRQVTQLSGAATDCSHISGTVTIPQLPANSATPKYAIDSHVVGCTLVDGGQCNTGQAAFVDATEPVFSPTGTTSYSSVRIAPGSTCADVRTMFP